MPLRLTTDQRRDFSPVWSPDGRWIAFLRNANGSGLFSETGTNELRLVPPLGGPERKLADVRVRSFSSSYLSWCPDSKCLVITDAPGKDEADALYLFWPETGEKAQLTHPIPRVQGDNNPAFSPDGKSLVFRRSIAYGAGELYRLALRNDRSKTGEPEKLTPVSLNARFPAWLPDSQAILFSAKGFLWRLSVLGKNQPARLPFVGEDGLMAAISRAASGKSPRLVYARSFRDMNIRCVSTDGSGAPAIKPPFVAISSTRADLNARLSPTGDRVAFQSNRSGEMEIWLADLDGGNAVPLTSLGAENTSTPAWQDGQSIYFMSNRSGQDQIWRMPLSGGAAVQITHNMGVVAFEAPDGSLYYSQTAGRPSPIWRLPNLGGEPVKIVDYMVHRSFVVLKTGIYYVDDWRGLQFFDFRKQQSKTVLKANGMEGGLSASPDGRIILYNSEDSRTDDLMLVEGFR